MSDCRFGVSPVNYPDPDPDRRLLFKLDFYGVRDDTLRWDPVFPELRETASATGGFHVNRS